VRERTHTHRNAQARTLTQTYTHVHIHTPHHLFLTGSRHGCGCGYVPLPLAAIQHFYLSTSSHHAGVFSSSPSSRRFYPMVFAGEWCLFGPCRSLGRVCKLIRRSLAVDQRRYCFVLLCLCTYVCACLSLCVHVCVCVIVCVCQVHAWSMELTQFFSPQFLYRPVSKHIQQASTPQLHFLNTEKKVVTEPTLQNLIQSLLLLCMLHAIPPNPIIRHNSLHICALCTSALQ